MANQVRLRLLGLLSLTVLGVLLAVTGTALGFGESESSSARITVSDNGITVSNGVQKSIIVDNMSDVRKVGVSAENGQIQVETETNDINLIGSKRARAIRVAKVNETVSRALNDSKAHKFEVQPLKQLNASSAQSFNVSLSGQNQSGNQQGRFTVKNVNMSDDGESVTIRRQEPVSLGRVVVRILDSDGELWYSVEVDLDAGTVLEITDWTDD